MVVDRKKTFKLFLPSNAPVNAHPAAPLINATSKTAMVFMMAFKK